MKTIGTLRVAGKPVKNGYGGLRCRNLPRGPVSRGLAGVATADRPVGGMKRIVVLGAGFAGLIAAIGAARKLAELKIAQSEASVTVLNRDRWHAIRVRNYETDLSEVRVPLGDVLDPIGVDLAVGEMTGLDCDRREIAYTAEGRPFSLSYDRLVFALGSELARPPIPGLAEYGFDIDTYDAAKKLAAHLAALPTRPDEPGRFTALVVGGGLDRGRGCVRIGHAACLRSPRAGRRGSSSPTGRCGSVPIWATAPAR